MTTLIELITKLKDDGYEIITIEMLEKNIVPQFLEKEKQQIIDAYDNGEWMQSVKERLDYDHEDYKFNNSDEYYNTIWNIQEVKTI